MLSSAHYGTISNALLWQSQQAKWWSLLRKWMAGLARWSEEVMWQTTLAIHALNIWKSWISYKFDTRHYTNSYEVFFELLRTYFFNQLLKEYQCVVDISLNIV